MSVLLIYDSSFRAAFVDDALGAMETRMYFDRNERFMPIDSASSNVYLYFIYKLIIASLFRATIGQINGRNETSSVSLEINLYNLIHLKLNFYFFLRI